MRRRSLGGDLGSRVVPTAFIGWGNFLMQSPSLGFFTAVPPSFPTSGTNSCKGLQTRSSLLNWVENFVLLRHSRAHLGRRPQFSSFAPAIGLLFYHSQCSLPNDFESIPTCIISSERNSLLPSPPPREDLKHWALTLLLIGCKIPRLLLCHFRYMKPKRPRRLKFPNELAEFCNSPTPTRFIWRRRHVSTDRTRARGYQRKSLSNAKQLRKAGSRSRTC